MTKIITKQHQDQAVKALQRLIAKPSAFDEKTVSSTTPFGKGIDAALDEVLAIAKENGLQTYKDPNGNYGWAEIGTGDKTFGIIGHMDTVPVGNLSDWEHGPYSGDIVDGIIYGRGAQDDKGPAMATMFAVKAILDADYQLNCKIRFIFGTDEETLWRDMDVYNKIEPQIDFGIAPDAEFPLIYAEKGLEQAYLVGPGSVSYTHLTLPTINPVLISVVSVPFRKYNQ